MFFFPFSSLNELVEEAEQSYCQASGWVVVTTALLLAWEIMRDRESDSDWDSLSQLLVPSLLAGPFLGIFNHSLTHPPCEI